MLKPRWNSVKLSKSNNDLTKVKFDIKTVDVSSATFSKLSPPLASWINNSESEKSHNILQ